MIRVPREIVPMRHDSGIEEIAMCGTFIAALDINSWRNASTHAGLTE